MVPWIGESQANEYQTYESIQWDSVQRHIKFTLGFAVEASHLQ